MNEKLSRRPPAIHTPRLALRPFIAEDEPAAAALLRSPKIAQTYILPDLSAPGSAEALFGRLLLLSHSPEHFVYGIYLENALIGFLNDVEITGDTIELGYVIAPAHWNRGYATEALAAALEALFALGYAAVRAGFFESNAASRRVMEKCGLRPAYMTQEIPYRGQVRRCIYYEARNSDLQSITD